MNKLRALNQFRIWSQSLSNTVGVAGLPAASARA